MKYSFIISVIVLMVSCSSSKHLKEDALLYYGKTACLGKCPVFDMYIFEDGKVMYEGLKNVDLKGKHEFKLSSTEIKEIKQELETIAFSSEEKIKRDVPNVILKLKGNKLVTQHKEKIKNLMILLEKIKS